jgi:ABC-type branched-subunit amino acid transport system substrate-binding protein
VNDAGGIDGRQVKLIQEDTPLGVDPTVSAVRKLISSNNVDAIFGTNSAGIMSIVDIARDAKICVMSPVAGTRELANVGGKFIFRSSPGDELGGRVVSLAVSSPDYDKAYERMALVLATRSNDLSYKQPIRDSFEGTITTIKEVSPDATSYTSAMDDVISSDPEMIFFAMPPENGIRLMKAGFQQGYEGNWFGEY